MGDWIKFHKDHWKCNHFDKVKDSDQFKNEESKRNNAKHDAERYIFFYERYVNHDKSETAANKLLVTI